MFQTIFKKFILCEVPWSKASKIWIFPFKTAVQRISGTLVILGQCAVGVRQLAWSQWLKIKDTRCRKVVLLG